MGTRRLEVVDSAAELARNGFVPGCRVRIGEGERSEDGVVDRLGSIVLRDPLLNDWPAGTSVTVTDERGVVQLEVPTKEHSLASGFVERREAWWWQRQKLDQLAENAPIRVHGAELRISVTLRKPDGGAKECGCPADGADWRIERSSAELRVARESRAVEWHVECAVRGAAGTGAAMVFAAIADDDGGFKGRAAETAKKQALRRALEFVEVATLLHHHFPGCRPDPATLRYMIDGRWGPEPPPAGKLLTFAGKLPLMTAAPHGGAKRKHGEGSGAGKKKSRR